MAGSAETHALRPTEDSGGAVPVEALELFAEVLS
jgi:hypothetical protein